MVEALGWLVCMLGLAWHVRRFCRPIVVEHVLPPVALELKVNRAINSVDGNLRFDSEVDAELVAFELEDLLRRVRAGQR